MKWIIIIYQKKLLEYQTYISQNILKVMASMPLQNILRFITGLGYDVDLSNYRVELYSSGSSTPSTTQNLTGKA